MITPENITNYNRTEAELEEFLLFAIIVAGKTAKTQAEKLNRFLVGLATGNTPFEYLQSFVDLEKDGHNALDGWMRGHKIGQYKRIGAAFRGILQFKNRLKSVTLEELESVTGIGSKTSRFFLLHSRPDQRLAVLDTHILKWMKSKGYDVPKTTPSNKKKYRQIELDFLAECDKAGRTPADLDLAIWKMYAKQKQIIDKHIKNFIDEYKVAAK